MTDGLSRRQLLTAAAPIAGAAALGTLAWPRAAGASGVLNPGARNRIDVHCHLIPDFYRASLKDHGITSAGGKALPPWSPAQAVLFMDEFGIQTQVVSISEPGVYYLPDAAERVAMARKLNDYMRQTLIGTTNPIYAKRFGAFAVLPLGDLSTQDVQNACEEAVRAITVLGLDGVGLYSNYHGVYLGDPRLNPLMTTLNKLKAFVFVHPVTPLQMPDLGLPPFLFEFPFDTTRAATNLLYKNVLLLHPGIRWLLAHAGGTLPFLSYRISLLRYTAPLAQNLGLNALDQEAPELKRLFVDTALSPTAAAMQSARAMTSVSHVMFATDWPFSEEIFTIPGDPAPQLADTFTADEQAKVLHGNALTQMPTLAKRLSA